MHQFSDRIVPWLAYVGGALLALVVGFFVVTGLLERRRERVREAEAVAVLLPAASTVDERPIEEIAQDGMTDDERADAARDARLAAYFAHDYRAELRARTIQLQADLIGIERRACASAELSAEAIARLTRQIDDRTRRYASLAELRADLLVDACRYEGAEDTTTMIDSQVGWPQAWEDELDALLAEAVPA